MLVTLDYCIYVKPKLDVKQEMRDMISNIEPQFDNCAWSSKLATRIEFFTFIKAPSLFAV